jgi:F-type H+-transporting ATPase subunit b
MQSHAVSSIATLILPAINLSILVGALVYYLRKPLGEFVSGRHTAVRDELLKVREHLRLAQEKYDEFSSKLSAIEAETASMREQALKDGHAVHSRVAAAAQRHSAQIISDARAAGDAMFDEMKGAVYLELGSSVLDRAEVLMREKLTGDDRARIRREFSKQVESVQ